MFRILKSVSLPGFLCTLIVPFQLAQRVQVSKKVATTKIDLLGNFKSESNGVYNLKGKTNPGAKVWYRYKVGSKTFKNSLLANKSGKFQIRVVNTSADQDTTNVEVDVKAKGLKQNYDVASIENHSSEFVSKRSKRYKLTSSDKAYLASSRVKASYDKKGMRPSNRLRKNVLKNRLITTQKRAIQLNLVINLDISQCLLMTLLVTPSVMKVRI
ncbi:hypothetical protein N627_1006 [Levilactobacillus brevis]|nr:hypothetical protein N627_1006 [Levilactobacillus brevis]